MTDQPDATSILIRAIRAGDDLDAQVDLAERSFGPADRDRRRQLLADWAGEGRTLGAFDRHRLAGAAMFHDMRQWWCGRAVPMAGVAGVKVAPEDRGRGIARRLMAALLAEVAARGYPLSVLYPATVPLYRSLGWELAGTREVAVITRQDGWTGRACNAGPGAGLGVGRGLRRLDHTNGPDEEQRRHQPPHQHRQGSHAHTIADAPVPRGTQGYEH